METTEQPSHEAAVPPAERPKPPPRDPALGSSVRATGIATLVLSAVCAVLVDPWWALGTLIGGMLATANLILFIRIVETFLIRKGQSAPWALLWALKLLGLFFCAFVILRQGDVSALAFVLGYGALPIGIAVSSLTARASDPGAADPKASESPERPPPAAR